MAILLNVLTTVNAASAAATAAVDPVRCGVMCGNVTRTGADWQLCVPGFFQWSLSNSSGVDLPSAPLNLKRMLAAGRHGATYTVPRLVRGRHYQLFYRENPSRASGRAWTFWQRLGANATALLPPPDLVVPPCGPVCGDVPFSQKVALNTSNWQPFCQAGMLKGELGEYGVKIGPTSPTGLKFPFHLQELLRMQPGTFGPIEHVLLGGEIGYGRMLFRQGLHPNGWVAIFQQRFIAARVKEPFMQRGY
jgi:hypothetical protein